MIEKVNENTIETLVDFAHKLWPDSCVEALRDDFLEVIADEDSGVFLYRAGENGFAGFIQLSLRHDYVEGCDGSPVAYVEGIYVEEAFRRCKVAQALIAFAETWGTQKGCTELASDCELTNTLSIQFHSGSGFVETNRLVCFKKSLGGAAQ